MAVLLSACGAADPAPPRSAHSPSGPWGTAPLPESSGFSRPTGSVPFVRDPSAGPAACTPRTRTACDLGQPHWYDSCGERGAAADNCTDGERCVEDALGARCEAECDAPYVAVCVGDDVLSYRPCGSLTDPVAEGRITECPAGQPCRDLGGWVDCDCSGPTTTFCTEYTSATGYYLFERDACGEESSLPLDYCGPNCNLIDGIYQCGCPPVYDVVCWGVDVVEWNECETFHRERCVAPEVCAESSDWGAACVCTGAESSMCVDGDVWLVDGCGALGAQLAVCDGESGACAEDGGAAGCGGVVVDRTGYPTVGGFGADDRLLFQSGALRASQSGAALTVEVGYRGAGGLGYFARCDLRVGGVGATAPTVWAGTLSSTTMVDRDTFTVEAWESPAAFAAEPCGGQRELFLTCDAGGVTAAVYGPQPIVLEKVCP